MEMFTLQYSVGGVYSDTTYFSTTSARTLSLNLCPHCPRYSSEVSITCWWINCSDDTNSQTQISVLKLSLHVRCPT